MTVLEKQRIGEQTEPIAPAHDAAPAVPAAPTRGLRAAVLWMLAAAMVVGIVVAAILVSPVGDDAQPVGEPAALASTNVRSEQQILADLAARGYIPPAAVNRELLATERLVNQKVIPAETLELYRAPTAPLFTKSELATIELAESGQIPMEAVDWQEVVLKRLINRGMIPGEALNH